MTEAESSIDKGNGELDSLIAEKSAALMEAKQRPFLTDAEISEVRAEAVAQIANGGHPVYGSEVTKGTKGNA